MSQLTSLVLLGIDPRRFLDLLVPACRPDVVPIGKLRLIELSRAVEALRAMSAKNDNDVLPVEHDDDVAQPTTAAEVLSAIGKEFAS